jgi:hypothetical protein
LIASSTAGQSAYGGGKMSKIEGVLIVFVVLLVVSFMFNGYRIENLQKELDEVHQNQIVLDGRFRDFSISIRKGDEI